jgi:ABC-2 type transport system permease protein
MDPVKMLKDSYHIMHKDLLGLTRNRMSLAALFIMPIAFLVMFGFIFPGASTASHMPVGVVDLDNGQESSAFISQLNAMNNANNKTMNLQNFTSVDTAKTQINQGKLSGIFIIPSGFTYNMTHGQQGKVIVYEDNSNPQMSTQMEAISAGTVSGLNSQLAQQNVMKMTNSTNQTANAQTAVVILYPYSASIQKAIPGQTNYFDFLAPGLMIMIVMMTVMTGIPEAISKEKEIGTFDGMLSAPINQVSIILGKTAALCVRGFGQAILILLLAVLFFGVTIQGSIILAFFMLLLGIFSFIGIGIVAVSMSEDQASGTMIVNLLMFPMMFLAGIFYPLQQMPWFMQDISQLIPLTYAADAMRKIMLLNANLGDVMTQILILVGFGIVTMAIAIPLFRKSMTR